MPHTDHPGYLPFGRRLTGLTLEAFQVWCDAERRHDLVVVLGLVRGEQAETLTAPRG